MPTLTTDAVGALQEQVRALAAEQNAVILAHNYQLPEVQDVADLVGDSLGLSQAAAHTESDVIAFCGVHFMAETAAILSPTKKVLLPDLAAGCSLASTIDAVSAMKWTPQKAITSSSVAAACWERPSESPTKSATSWTSGRW